MFRFRGQKKDGGWVEGGLTRERVLDESRSIYYIEDDELNLYMDIPPETLSISTGKRDSKGEEIFASFPIDGVMTEGGDVVEIYGDDGVRAFKYRVEYSDLEWVLVDVEYNKVCFYLKNYSDKALTIIGKQGGGNDRRLNIMAQIGMERTDLHT